MKFNTRFESTCYNFTLNDLKFINDKLILCIEFL